MTRLRRALARRLYPEAFAQHCGCCQLGIQQRILDLSKAQGPILDAVVAAVSGQIGGKVGLNTQRPGEPGGR